MWLKWKQFLLASMILFYSMYLPTYANTNDSGVKVKWGYKGNIGPSWWSKLSPDFSLCNNGKWQSPISINKQMKMTKAANDLIIHYQPASMKIILDGITDLTLEKTKILVNDGHGIQINYPVQSTKEEILFKNKLYKLKQFHLHSPSENELNGENFPMEIHFVHQSDDGQVLVIAVWVKAGARNIVLQKMLKYLPKRRGIETAINKESINPGNLLPQTKDYYSFIGSLTTPPCLEGLQWLVMANPIQASTAQIVLFRNAVDGSNARPIQSLNHRQLTFSLE